MKVGIDLDGVCYDFGASLAYYLTTHCGWDPARCTPPARWEFYEDWGLPLPEFLATCAAGVDAGVVFTHGDPLPGVKDALDRLAAAGHSLHIITDRARGAAQAATAQWLTAHDLPYDTLTFAADKTVLWTEVMVDDKRANIDALEEAGTWGYLMDRPWNQYEGVLPRYRRVADLTEFADAVLAT